MDSAPGIPGRSGAASYHEDMADRFGLIETEFSKLLEKTHECQQAMESEQEIFWVKQQEEMQSAQQFFWVKQQEEMRSAQQFFWVKQQEEMRSAQQFFWVKQQEEMRSAQQFFWVKQQEAMQSAQQFFWVKQQEMFELQSQTLNALEVALHTLRVNMLVAPSEEDSEDYGFEGSSGEDDDLNNCPN